MLGDIDLKNLGKIVIDETKKVVKAYGVDENLQEAYVAQPKQYRQVTEFLSQKTKDAHEELYKRYIKSLNDISAKLDSVDKTTDSSSHSDFRSNKLDEAYNLNAVWLHELYFANCFDPNSEIFMDSIAYIKLQNDFGTFDDWQKDFSACAMSCGNGWAICGYNIFLKKYVNTVISNHSQDVMMGLIPIIVVDMHEHAYYKDYILDKKSYLLSQLRSLNWTVIEERFTRTEAIARVVK